MTVDGLRDRALASGGYTEPGGDPVNKPNYYILPNGAEVADISEWLSAAGAQAMQYIVRATRIDGIVKENPVQDIDKAIYWLKRERKRLTP